MILGGTGSDNALSCTSLKVWTDALEAVRRYNSQRHRKTDCLLQTSYGSKLFDVLEEFAYFSTLSSHLAGIVTSTLLP